jgi:hypothetical protein
MKSKLQLLCNEEKKRSNIVTDVHNPSRWINFVI